MSEQRRMLQHLINAEQAERVKLEEEHGQVWDTKELQQDFTVVGFMAPFIKVVRKSDDIGGVLTFQHVPRFYWGFQPL